MTLPASGLITIADIVAEFGAVSGAPHLLTEYYRVGGGGGGTVVPNIAANAGVPQSGAITIQDFYSATAFNYAATLPSGSGPNFLKNMEIVTHTFNPGEPSAGGITFASDGNWAYYDVMGSTVHTTYPSAGPTAWLTGDGGGSDYDIRLDIIGGVPTGDGYNTWLNLGTSRYWYAVQAGDSSDQWNGTIRIRPAGGGADLATCSLIVYTTFDV